MKTIKLDAIDSTNDFLKALVQSQTVENFTIVTANKQTKGKGQMGSVWHTEDSKNLISSILIKDVVLKNKSIFELNIAVANAIVAALKKFEIPLLSIKWPNDIMSGNKKIAGLLIENLFRGNKTIESIVGIGLNVNQTHFDNLPKATSLKNVSDRDFEIDTILNEIVKQLEINCQLVKEGTTTFLWENYHSLLFKIGTPIVFQNEKKGKFMGIIHKVNQDGLLEIRLEDDSIEVFGIKEITMLY